MTPRERLLAVLHNELPDCVPCCPDISNMVPCRLTGKPFWDIYAFEDPPLWKAHIDALHYFDLDGGFELYDFGPCDIFDDASTPPTTEQRVIKRNPDGSFVTRHYHLDTDTWAPRCVVFTADNPPATGVNPLSIGLPELPSEWEPLPEGKKWPRGLDLWLTIRKEIGDRGVLGLGSGMSTCVLGSPDDVYAYYENPVRFHEHVEKKKEYITDRMKCIAAMEIKPDFLFCGGSGTLIWQTPDVFRELVLPLLQHTTRLAADIGLPTHVHSCGPESELVRMAAEESCLTIIAPLEIPPMGDCNLADLKKRYGDKIVLKGNLHTTTVMLDGSVDDVVAASRKAIDDAAQGGGFILSTGDQCGRDTPDANIRAMVETARTYGRYDRLRGER